MATINDIRSRAQALRDKTESHSITAKEVGDLLLDLTALAQTTERDAAILGIRKVYPSLAALNEDVTAPIGTDGKALRRGNLVVVYDPTTEKTDPEAGRVYIYRGDAWEMAGRLGNFDLVELIHQQLQAETQARTAADASLSASIERLQEDFSQELSTLGQSHIALEQRVTEESQRLTDLADNVGHIEIENYGTAQTQLNNHRARIDEVDAKTTQETALRIQGDANLLLKVQEEGRLRATADAELRHALSTARQELQGYADRAGKVKGISRNGIPQSISPEGIVDLLIESGVDEEKVREVVLDALAKADEPTYNVETQAVEGGTQVTLTTERGHIVAEFVVAGGGGGGTATPTTYIDLPLRKEKHVYRKGERCVLTYSYNHRNTDGEPTGTPALLTISIQQGVKPAVVTTRRVQPSAQSYELDLSDYTKELGTIVVRITAQAEDAKRTVAATLDVRELSLRLQSTDCITKATQGGHTSDVVIPYYISGAGSKTVTLLVNGEHTLLDEHITAARTQVRQLIVPASLLRIGRNSIQLIAEADGLNSECIYFDVFYNPQRSISSFVGVYVSDTKRGLQRDSHDLPTIAREQYEYLTIKFVAYGVSSLTLSPDGTRFAPSNGLVSYDKRYKRSGLQTITLGEGSTSKSVRIEVQPSSIGNSDSEVALVCDLDADGRSNYEQSKDSWTSGAVRTSFEGVDFVSSGWENGALCLRGGAAATIGYLPFSSANDPTAKGWTMEVELRTDTVLDADRPVLSCLHEGLGLAIYPNKAMLLTGKEATIKTEEGEVRTPLGVERALSTATFTRIAFVVHTKANHRLMELYANGVRIAAAIYPPDGSLVQAQPQPIRLLSTDANVSVRQVKAYERALSDDELLSSYITSRTTAAEMQAIKERNNVLNNQGNYEAPRTTKRGRLFIKREGGLVPVFQSTNKKEMFACEEVRYESPYGSDYDLVATNISISIQGTSSTKYPWKNIRLYLDGKEATIRVGGQVVENKKYRMSPTAKPVGIITLKCDYSDSSMTHNTGFARLWHRLCAELGILSPAQRTDPTARTSIEGYPCDLYSQEADGSYQYYGQYNFNNDKSKSDAVFGMEGLRADLGAMSLEMLNNTQPLCLFQTAEGEDYAQFDKAVEFNIPAYKGWAKATEAHRTKIKRLWGWIGDCARAVGMSPDKGSDFYADVSKFTSPRFKREVGQYFDVDNLLLWYLLTDYLALVDQRAKNMILRTWDGDKWYMTYYDGDTALGVRNDSLLAYLYDVERSTRDLAVGKYAFEGHDSWLWCLVLANLSDELRAMAKRLRSVMTNEAVLRILNEEQQGAWSETAYNKSGHLKYIVPATIGTEVSRGGAITHEVSNYLHALQGERRAHRSHFIAKRFAFLDAMYLTDSFRTDNIDGYISRMAWQADSIIGITASERYRYGYGTNNAPFLSTTPAIAKGELVELHISGSYTLNDPIRIYGASAIRTLDLTKIVPSGATMYPLQNGLVLSKCTALREIRAGLDTPIATANFTLMTAGVMTLEHVDVRGIRGISVGQAGSFDLSTQRRLRYLDARDTGATSIALAEGAQLTTAKMPETLTTLTLRSLPRLTMEGLQVEDWQGITALNFANCPQLSWHTLLDRCTALTHLRIEGVSLRGDGTDLDKWARWGGLAADGSRIEGCRLVGSYQLTRWRDDIEQLRSAFPELEIRQPEYTLIEFAEDIMDERNVTNEDNQTGYRYGKPYAPSGHITAILAMRHRVMAKKRDNKWIYTLLDDETAERYADGSSADLEGRDGEIYIREPRYWTKGINDFLRNRKYALYASVKPSTPTGIRIERNALQREKGLALKVGETLSASRMASTGWSIYIVDLPREMQQVRWTPSNGISTYSLFLDANDNVVRRISSVDSNGGMLSGMYLFANIPEGAVRLVFAHNDDDTFDYVWLTQSTEIADIEPEWVEHQPKLVGAVKADVQLRSVKHNNLYVNMTHSEAENAARGKGAGWEIMQYETWKDIVQLIIALHGTITCYAHARINAKNMGNSLTEPIGRLYTMRRETTDRDAYYMLSGQEINSNYHTHTLGYDRWAEGSTEWLGGLEKIGGYSKWKFTIGARSSLYNSQNWGGGWTGYLRFVMHGLYMDLLYVSQGVTSTQRYKSFFDITNDSVKTYACNIWHSDDDGYNLVRIWQHNVNSRSTDMSVRLQYTGEMEEVSTEKYKER